MQTYSYAYLDPATGSLILQYLIAGIAAVASTASFFWTKIRNFIVKKILRKEIKEDSSKENNANK
tara:strand:+ start:9769 stop:9963 length:195 start_codon:yes stop_codon:yes gene_type:complete